MRERELVDKLHAAIDQKYAENEWKGTWRNLTNEQCRGLMFKEINELFTSIEDGDFENAILEAADIALFCVFFADPERVKTILKLVKVLDKDCARDILEIEV